MIVERTDDGVIVDAVDLAPLLDLQPDAIPRLMKTGAITSRYETGAGPDTDKFRITFLYDGKQVRLTCDASGAVRSTMKSPVHGCSGTPIDREKSNLQLSKIAGNAGQQTNVGK